MKKVRHVLGISGGKDSAALAIYLKNKYPHLDIEYYTCDTGKELEETYELIKNLEVYLGKPILRLRGAENSHEQAPFDHFHQVYGRYLPSSNSRWCTQKLKLEPFERFVGTDPVISYVGIRGDEEREGYISKKTNIQSIFPFRKNIWSEDVINKALSNPNKELLSTLYRDLNQSEKLNRILEINNESLSPKLTQSQKLNLLLDVDAVAFNKVIFSFIKTTSYPLSLETNFPLLENDEVLVKEDIFRILRESGVGVPKYYEDVEFELNSKKGTYSRSRSGCFFCFYQRKIEWVWLYEQHPDKFAQAIEYEKEGYTWMDDERLVDLIRPERINQIKEEQIRKAEKIANNKNSRYLLDILDNSDSEGCASCFI